MFDLTHHSVHVVRMDRGLPAPPRSLLQSGAGVIEPAVVVPEDVAGLIRHPRQLRNVIRHRAEAFFTFSQRNLRTRARHIIALRAQRCGARDQYPQQSSQQQKISGLIQASRRVSIAQRQ